MMRTMILSVTRQNLRTERGMLGCAPRCIRSKQICTSTSSKGGLVRQLEEARFLMHGDIQRASTNRKFSTTAGKLFLQQSKGEKGLSAQSNALLDPDYLDAMVRFLYG